MSKAPPRPSMSKARRARIFEAHGGLCELCGVKIRADEDYDIEHRIPWAVSHDDSDPNLYPAHKACHADKTSGRDAGYIAKSKAMAGETGQWARRQKRGGSSIKSAGFQKGGPKQKIPSRPFGR